MIENKEQSSKAGEDEKTPGEEFIRWAMEHCRMKEVYDRFEFANDATGFNTFYHPIVNKINKIFKERNAHPSYPRSPWISVDVQLPPAQQEVLTTMRETGKLSVNSMWPARWQDEKWFKVHFSHWMRAPDGPQEPNPTHTAQ